jgi:hypothetical protein
MWFLDKMSMRKLQYMDGKGYLPQIDGVVWLD